MMPYVVEERKVTSNTKVYDSFSFSLKKQDLDVLPLRKKYRGYFDIIALVLEASKDNDASRFSIMKYAGINCNQLRKYLEPLTEIGFIEAYRGKGRCMYRTSDKGLVFLRQYHALLGLLLSATAGSKLDQFPYETQYATARLDAQLQRNP